MDIKLVILDVDGTLTDGGIYISSDGTEIKQFQAKDGLIVRLLPKFGIQTFILTGRDSKLTQIRANDLNISFVIQGVNNKADTLARVMAEYNMQPHQTAYIGDDLNDYAAMKQCGFKACPFDAAEEIKAISDYVSPYSGGHGAVRDICEHILKKDGKYHALLTMYGIDCAEK